MADDLPVFRFVFDPDYSGVSGNIAFHYYGQDRGGSDVVVQLGVNRFNVTALKAVEKSCTADKITEFTWHIHTKWTLPAGQQAGSTSFANCAKALTGNHYDPYKICGPASEYVDTPACQAKVKDYKCTPDEYKKNFAACESGDLSGKFGNIKPDDKDEFTQGFSDMRFPFPSEATDQWTIVLHAVCGTATPRVACAQGAWSMGSPHMKTKDDEYGANEETQISVGKLHVRVHTHDDDDGKNN